MAELARVVQDKTEGNPFYELQFLSALVRDGLLYFDKETGQCRWADVSMKKCVYLEKASISITWNCYSSATERRTGSCAEALLCLEEDTSQCG